MIKRKLTETLAQNILKEKRALLESIKLSQSEIEERILECEQVYLKYKKACDLKEEGYPAHQIAKQIDSNFRGVLDWSSKSVPFVFNKITSFSKSEMKLNPETHLDLLYLIGAFQGARFSKSGDFHGFGSKYKQDLETLILPIYKVFSIVPHITNFDSKRYWQIKFGSKKFLDYFNQHTEQDQHLPWKLMPTLEEKAAYFKGYFLKSSALNGERIIFRFSCEPILKTEFAVLLGDLGLVPGCNAREVELFDYVDLKKILDEGWCLSRRKELALRRIARQKINKHNCSPEEIITLLDELKQGKIKPLKVIKQYHIPRHSLQNWIYGRSVPRRVGRYLKLNELVEKVRTNPEYAYTEHDVPLKHLFNMFVPEREFGEPKLVRISHQLFQRYLKNEPDYSQFVKRKGEEWYVAREYVSRAEEVLTFSLPGYKKRSLEEARELTCTLEQTK